MKKEILFWGVLTSVLSFVSAHAGDNNGVAGSHGIMGNFAGWGMGFFGWVFSALIIVALIFLIIWLFKQIQKQNRRKK